MAYSQYGRESNFGPWTSELLYASTAAPEFKASSLGERWNAMAWNRYGAPLKIGLGGYGDTVLPSKPPGVLAGILDDIGGIVGPAIGAGVQAFEARATGAILQQPGVQQAALNAGKQQASVMFAQYAPYIVAGLVAVIVLPKLMRR